ncbi:putative helicase [Plesiocystis pacifica SIR-1]|uniref:DNA 3'-5' helicase II n=1 Tax=Plesiocystis pacifica SIR-1 TaxID=391625 RepID=A6GF90_9BACT|nr:UvrD-helicase domain-containing protein [Plesiocystis pacifica]EDM75487.1 putative helicase [Plesiocystis pacifica SIR-1]
MSERLTSVAPETPSAEPTADALAALAEGGRDIVAEELSILERIQARVEEQLATATHQFEDLNSAMIELRDEIATAKEEDLASLMDQMHQLAALNAKRGSGRTAPVDPQNPYFGHLRLREARMGKLRDVLIGKRTMLDKGDGLSIVDWRNAPVSRLYYRYDELDEYEEEFDDRSIEGTVLLRRSVVVGEGKLRRIDTPQGSFALGRGGAWRDLGREARPSLAGGTGKAVRVPRGQLGVNNDLDGLADKRLQEITALIDKQQFGLITQPESGVVLIQGGAGSGKTTVALHRVAYLAFQDRRRFSPEKMLIVVFNEALVEYIRHVLPSLGVEGVTVTTYRRWSAALLRRLRLDIPAQRTDSTPEAVVRFKKHPMVLEMIAELVAEDLADVERSLEDRLRGRPGGEQVLEQWRKLAKLPPSVRGHRALRWLIEEDGRNLPAKTRAAAETSLRAFRGSVDDVVGDWAELFGDGRRIRNAIASKAPDEFSDSEVNTIVKWCAKKTSALIDWRDHKDEPNLRRDDDDDEPSSPRKPPRLDGEDDAVIMRLYQAKRGGLFVKGKRFEYEHIVIDEAQDLCPIEVRVLLDTASAGRSVTIAGDKAQKMIFDNGFVDWPQLLEDAGLPHVAIQPLKITYRSTRQVMAIAQHVLGHLHDPNDDLIARDGAPVSYFGFSDMGESVAFLGEALRNLMQREPTASVALLTRYPQQAEAYYEALHIAEVPRLRLVSRQDFTFLPGIDVTDVRQVKGLEFDYVIVLDPTRQNYPVRDSARHLLHIACTRTAYQLWLVCSGRPSPLVPQDLIDEDDEQPPG